MTTKQTQVPGQVPADGNVATGAMIRSVRSAADLSPRDLAGRSLMWLAALAAAVTAIGGIFTVLGAGAATMVVETWRLYGFMVFAGLFALLALRPRGYRGIWELVILNKLALTATALGYAAHGGIDGAGTVIGWDGGLTVVLVAGYICCRGWTGGSRRRATRHRPPRRANSRRSGLA